MIRKHKNYSRPRKLYDSVRIGEENKLVEKYALKNKREIWKTEAKVRYFRTRAKSLITASTDEQNRFFRKLIAIGLNASTISDVLALTKEDLLQRRLTSVLVQRGLARTALEARQMVAHKRVKIDGGIVSTPGYLVPVSEESQIVVKHPVVMAKAREENVEEVSSDE